MEVHYNLIIASQLFNVILHISCHFGSCIFFIQLSLYSWQHVARGGGGGVKVVDKHLCYLNGLVVERVLWIYGWDSFVTLCQFTNLKESLINTLKFTWCIHRCVLLWQQDFYSWKLLPSVRWLQCLCMWWWKSVMYRIALWDRYGEV